MEISWFGPKRISQMGKKLGILRVGIVREDDLWDATKRAEGVGPMQQRRCEAERTHVCECVRPCAASAAAIAADDARYTRRVDGRP